MYTYIEHKLRNIMYKPCSLYITDIISITFLLNIIVNFLYFSFHFTAVSAEAEDVYLSILVLFMQIPIDLQASVNMNMVCKHTVTARRPFWGSKEQMA